MGDHDAFYDVFYDEDLRFDFMLAFKRLTKSLNLCSQARQALEFMDDYKALTEINVLAGKHFRDQRLSMKGDSGEASCDHGYPPRVPGH